MAKAGRILQFTRCSFQGKDLFINFSMLEEITCWDILKTILFFSMTKQPGRLIYVTYVSGHKSENEVAICPYSVRCPGDMALAHCMLISLSQMLPQSLPRGRAKTQQALHPHWPLRTLTHKQHTDCLAQVTEKTGGWIHEYWYHCLVLTRDCSLFVCLFVCLLHCLLGCLVACLLVCLLACLFGCLLACLLACLLLWVLACWVLACWVLPPLHVMEKWNWRKQFSKSPNNTASTSRPSQAHRSQRHCHGSIWSLYS